MCGILGIVNFDGQRADRELLERLAAVIRHRGPDDDGFFCFENIGLAMRRLSIIDLKGGAQPIYRRNGELVIVYNGELYNFRAIRKELEKKGRVFTTHADTEVVLAAYEEWGEACLERFNGIFAFAIHDRVKKELFLARDRLGVKPLYYYADSSRFVFSSEMKVILKHPEIKRRLDLGVVSQYLAYGHHAAGGASAIRGVRLLEPGHWLRISADGRTVDRPYWKIGEGVSDSYRSEDEAGEAVYALLVDSVRLQLVSDVKVCLMLSSGLDSGALAYILHKELQAPMSAFTVGVSSHGFDESDDAGTLARNFGMEWSRSLISPEDVKREFERIVYSSDSLQGNTAQLIYYFCNKAIHEGGYKVALNGSGGDELFFGYPTYQADSLFSYWRRLPLPLRTSLHAAAMTLPPGFGRVSMDYKIKKFTEFLEDDAFKAHASWRTVFTDQDQSKLFKDEFRGQRSDWYGIYRKIFDDCAPMPMLNKLQVGDVYGFLIPLLPWVDTMSMAHSVELRVPFLDHRLVEEAIRLPSEYKFKGWGLKRLMKNFLKGKLPEEILNMPKRGTHLPLGAWLNGGLKGLMDDCLSPKRLERLGLFDVKEVEALKNEHASRRHDHTFKLWYLMMLSSWTDMFEVGI